MRLTNINCPQCDGQLYQQQDKFYCSSCGSAFNIDYDAADVEYAKLITEADRTRLLMESNRAILEKDQELRRKFETHETKQEIKQIVKTQGMTMLGSLIMYGIMAGLSSIVFIVVLVILISNSVRDSRQRNKLEDENEKARIERLEDLSGEDIAKDKNFIENTIAAGAAYDTSLRSSTTIDDLHLDGVPEAVGCYVVKEGTEISLYNIYENNFVSDDGEDNHLVYSCVLFENIEADETDHIQCDLKSCKRVQDGDFDAHWVGYESIDQIKDDIIPSGAYEIELEEGGVA